MARSREKPAVSACKTDLFRHNEERAEYTSGHALHKRLLPGHGAGTIKIESQRKLANRRGSPTVDKCAALKLYSAGLNFGHGPACAADHEIADFDAHGSAFGALAITYITQAPNLLTGGVNRDDRASCIDLPRVRGPARQSPWTGTCTTTFLNVSVADGWV